MNIVCLTPWFPSDRGQQTGSFILDSVESLVSLGHQVAVLVTRPLRLSFGGPHAASESARHGLLDVAAARGTSITLVVYPSLPRNVLRPLSNWLYHARVAPALAGLARATNAHVIHAHTENAGAVATQVASALGLPSVVTIHGINTDHRLNSPRQRAFYRKHLSRASRVVLVGETLRAHAVSIIGRSDCLRVVHNGFKPPPADIAPVDWTPPLRMVSVSNLHVGKGIDITLQALRRLDDSGVTDWTYTIVGGGYQASKLQQLVRELRLSEKVSFAGPCDRDNVYRHLSRASVFVLPSYIEAFGIAYLEAMATGLLVIGVRAQGPSSFIRDGENGFLVEPQSVESLFACLHAISTDIPRMQLVACRGRDDVRGLSWRTHAEKLSAVLAEVV